MLAAFVAAAGCEGSGQDQALGDGPREIARTVCPKAYSCCMAAQLMGNDLAGTDERSCEVNTEQKFKEDFDRVKQSQDKGRADFDEAKFEECLATIRSSTCEMLNTTNHLVGVPGCDSFVIPKVALGGACIHDFECIGGWCQHEPGVFADGVCQPRHQAGAACNQGLCAPGLPCVGAEGAKMCIALAAQGAACAADGECASGNCPMPAAGGARTCGPPRSDKCFYGSSCSYSGPAPTALLGVLILSVAALVVRVRSRRA